MNKLSSEVQGVDRCVNEKQDSDSVGMPQTAPSHSQTATPKDILLEADLPVDYSCKVCGVECDLAPDPPARAVCPEHCDDHDYRYERELRGHYCFHCGQEAPQDWSDD